MGKKIKLASDSKLAKPHDAGSIIELTQPVLHDQFGAIYFITPKFYLYHFNKAEKSFQELEEFQEKILAIPVGTDNTRMIADLDFLREIYDAGFDMIVHLYLALDHFLLDALMFSIDDANKRKLINKWETMMRLNYFLKRILNRKYLINSAGYSKFAEIEKMRHAFNHPTSRRIYNADPGEWDEVPLAWVVSGKYKETYKSAIDFFMELFDIWENEKGKYYKPGTLINVQRGIKSEHQVKNPPKV